MKKIIMMMMIAVFLLASMNFVQSEIFLWNDVNINQDENLTIYHAFYKVDDTSEGFRWRNRDIPIEFFYNIQSLPFSLAGGSVDWCNFSITHYANEYDSEGNYVDTTINRQSIYFDSGVYDGIISIDVRDADEVTADVKCHYTNQSTLYQEHALIGRFDITIPSYECRGCSEYTLEELSNEVERTDEITGNELRIYNIMGIIVNLNYRLWLIVSWIIKIFLLVFAIGLLFGGVYYLYKFLEDIAKRI